MCYSIYFSTSSEEDFSSLGSAAFEVEAAHVEKSADLDALLEYKHKWFIMRHGCCSCDFRHWIPTVRTFAEPFEPEADDLDAIWATQEAYDLFRRILDEGHKLDIVNYWQGAELKSIETVEVMLQNVRREAFRFFEDCRVRAIA